MPCIQVKGYLETERESVEAEEKLVEAFEAPRRDSKAVETAISIYKRVQLMINFMRIYGLSNLLGLMFIALATFLCDAKRCEYALFS